MYRPRRTAGTATKARATKPAIDPAAYDPLTAMTSPEAAALAPVATVDATRYPQHAAAKRFSSPPPPSAPYPRASREAQSNPSTPKVTAKPMRFSKIRFDPGTPRLHGMHRVPPWTLATPRTGIQPKCVAAASLADSSARAATTGMRFRLPDETRGRCRSTRTTCGRCRRASGSSPTCRANTQRRSTVSALSPDTRSRMVMATPSRTPGDASSQFSEPTGSVRTGTDIPLGCLQRNTWSAYT